ncbi:hypothetical protein AA637_07005 [Cyanobacterium sp. HL-69]|uniref:hypothetical protein n=1 Tax=Cyanobacterium sp. HL-69 TaxID=2054282 RepID=UPI000CA3068B|nr:hypothetical protein AA637_07005 [Cyanobacterium sp. HL-69]
MSVKILEGINLGQKINTRWLFVITFAIASASALGTLGVVLLTWIALTTLNHQLKIEIINSHRKK